jgi:hypothetical protein
MVEVTLKFKEEDEEAYMTALNGWKYKHVLFELRSMLRTHDKGWVDKEFDTDYVREWLIEKLQEYNLSLD